MFLEYHIIFKSLYLTLKNYENLGDWEISFHGGVLVKACTLSKYRPCNKFHWANT